MAWAPSCVRSEKDRNRRYATASELSNEIQRHLRNEPVEAGPPGMGYRLRKWLGRHPVSDRRRTVTGGMQPPANYPTRFNATSAMSRSRRVRPEWDTDCGNGLAAIMCPIGEGP